MKSPGRFAGGLTQKLKRSFQADRKRFISIIVFMAVAVVGVFATAQVFGTTGLNGKVGVGNFVWLDSNKNGRVDGNEANQGINGVTVNLYANAADTDGDGELSVNEQAAATVIAAKTTANDTRQGATNGKPGYYRFTDLEPGDYFVGIAASNFSSGQPLQSLVNVPVPAGVGDTQDDNANHGKIPNGGSLSANGVISTRIKLRVDAEPTIYSSKKDDDDNHDTDMTIDFAFAHSYALGNRVWIDKDNSATINAADGNAPGVAGVTVRLLDSSGSNELAITTTDANGYYLFTNLNAGSYIVEVAASNFADGGPLKDRPVSSVAGAEEADPNANGDSNDNGLAPTSTGQAVRSGAVTLGPDASEPTGETDVAAGGQGSTDALANMTVDFGFVGTATWGDTVYNDFDGDGTQDTGEPGIPNVTVTLVCAGPDGNLATTADNTTQTKKTDANGNYLFTNLLPQTCKATVTTADVPGATLTTPESFTHTIVEQVSFLDADFGFVGNGSIGNQVFLDYNKNGRFDATDAGVEGVTLDLYYDANSNGQIDSGEVVIKTATTGANGQYSFTQLAVGNGSGIAYIVKVTDTGSKLTAFEHLLGNGAADNESKNPAGFGVTLTPAAPQRLEADFGYKLKPEASVPPKFWKDQDVEGTSLRYTLTWINLSTISMGSSFTDAIPAGTSYVADSLACEAKGTSQTAKCIFNAAQNRIEWQGTVGPDPGHFMPDTAVNPIVVTFKVRLAEDTMLVTNQGFGTYAPISDTTVPSDWIDTPQPDDPTIYTRTKTDVTIQKVTGGRLADTGQLVAASLAAAGTLIVLGIGFVFWARRRQAKA